jgi:hypothetical protein
MSRCSRPRMDADNVVALFRITPNQESAVNRSVSLILLALLVLVSAIALACGVSSRTLQSIAMNPAVANANGSAVQFVATGNYDAPPLHVTPQPATWGACQQNIPTNDVSVTSSGFAQCASGAAGTYTVFAYVNTNLGSCRQTVPQSQCGTGPCIVTGTAQLTCP